LLSLNSNFYKILPFSWLTCFGGIAFAKEGCTSVFHVSFWNCTPKIDKKNLMKAPTRGGEGAGQLNDLLWQWSLERFNSISYVAIFMEVIL
jgi:hypothetical protein